MKYYSKTWLKTQFIHFDITYNENMTCRTNNLCEAFHKSLTYSIEHSKPKMAIFVESMIKIVKTNFNNSVSNLVKINNNIQYTNNAYNLVYNFLKDYHINYKSSLDFVGLSQIDGDFKYKMDLININILKTLFGIRLEENYDEEKDKNDISKYDFEEINYLLPEKDEIENVNIFKNNEVDFINLIDVDYKKSFKRTYNDLRRFDELYDINFSENRSSFDKLNPPKLKVY